ncbi:Male-specific lethal 3 [Mactra antiquata]
MSHRGVKFSFCPGECVLCFEPDPTKARVIYEAKILDTTVYKDNDGKKKPGYHIHFLRWNNSWDRIVGENLVLKSSDENKYLMKQLADIAKKSCKNKSRRRRIKEALLEAFKGNPPFDDLDLDDGNTTDTNDTEDESVADSDNVDVESKFEDSKKSQRCKSSCDIDIPDSMKSILDTDYFTVCQDRKMHKLPAEMNVVQVLEGFVKSFMMDFWGHNFDRSVFCQDAPKIAMERILPICKEYVDGLRICFDFVLPTILLYDVEREQYDKLMITYKTKSPVRQKTPTVDSPLQKSLKSRLADSQSPSTEEPWPKIPKLSPNLMSEDDEVTFNPNTLNITPRRQTRRKIIADNSKKAESDNVSDNLFVTSDIKSEKSDLHKVVRKRRSSDRQDDMLRRRALRSYRKSSEDSNDSDQSKPDTIMSEPVKVNSIKSEKVERPPPLLIPCNVVLCHNDVDKVPEKKSGSVDSGGENGKEEILANILQWQLVPQEVLHQIPTPPSVIYGAHHLLRLFVKLPDLLSKMDIDDDRLGVLRKLTQRFFIYLSDHESDLFTDNV